MKMLYTFLYGSLLSVMATKMNNNNSTALIEEGYAYIEKINKLLEPNNLISLKKGKPTKDQERINH